MESPFVKIYHDDFSFDRAASATVKDAIREFLRDNHIQEAVFVDVSGGQKKAMQGLFLGGAGGRMNVGPIARAEASSQALEEARGETQRLNLNQGEASKLISAHKELSDAARLFANRIAPEKLSPAAPQQKEEITLNQQRPNK